MNIYKGRSFEKQKFCKVNNGNRSLRYEKRAYLLLLFNIIIIIIIIIIILLLLLLFSLSLSGGLDGQYP